MNENYAMSYVVDIVFCIDCTGSMDNVLSIVKENALHFYTDVQAQMREKGKSISGLRVRVVAFRDYAAYDNERRLGEEGHEPMLVTDFFSLPEEADKFELSVRYLEAEGGGDAPEDGLEALAYAIRSDWNIQSLKCRHVIVVWSDQEPHPLGFGQRSARYPRNMASDLSELTAWWGDRSDPGYLPKQSSKRLILFTPDMGAWHFISENWDSVIHFPSSAGEGLRELEYRQILNCISQTIA